MINWTYIKHRINGYIARYDKTDKSYGDECQIYYLDTETGKFTSTLGRHYSTLRDYYREITEDEAFLEAI